MTAPQLTKYKVIVCGRTHTGKTSLIRQYIEKAFMDSYFPTPLPMADSAQFKDTNGWYELAIWDTAGAEEWLSMNASAYHGAQVIVFVASFDEPDSLSEVITKWVPMLRDHLNLDDCVRILALNKSDLADRVFTDGDIEQTAEQLGAVLFQVSAKENTNVTHMFEFAAKEVRKKFPGETTKPVDTPLPKGKKKKKRKKCC
jgi:small GTP-binding protein